VSVHQKSAHESQVLRHFAVMTPNYGASKIQLHGFPAVSPKDVEGIARLLRPGAPACPDAVISHKLHPPVECADVWGDFFPVQQLRHYPRLLFPHSPYQHRKRFIRGWVQYTRKQRQMVKLMSELQRLKGKGRAGPPRVIAAALPAKSQKPLYIYTAFGILFYRNLCLSCFHHIWHKVKLASVCTQPPVE